jgi:hypothetical protein
MYFVTYDMDMSDGYNLPDLGPNIPSKLNLHTSIWALLEIYEENTDFEERERIFCDSIMAIQTIDPEDLYNLLLDFLPDYGIDEDSLLTYAEKILSFDKEELYAR